MSTSADRRLHPLAPSRFTSLPSLSGRLTVGDIPPHPNCPDECTTCRIGCARSGRLFHDTSQPLPAPTGGARVAGGTDPFPVPLAAQQEGRSVLFSGTCPARRG